MRLFFDVGNVDRAGAHRAAPSPVASDLLRTDGHPAHVVASTCIRGRNAQTMQKMVFKGGPGLLLLFRTYSIRICLQKLTESRIFTNAAFFISTR